MPSPGKQRTREKRPTKITVGNTTLRIYRGRYEKLKGGKPRLHEQFTVAFFSDGRRQRKTFSTIDDAKAWAQRRAEMLEDGHHSAAKLRDSDAASFALATRILSPLGIPLVAAVEEFVHARQKLPAGATLVEAVRDYAERQASIVASKTVAEVVAEFLEMREGEQKKKRASLRDVQTTRSHLNRFAAFAKKPIHMVQPADLSDWLRTTTEAPKTFNNIRTSLVRLFNYAREHRYIPQQERTAADLVKRMRQDEMNVVALHPNLLTQMLKDADEEASLYLSLAAFTGMRTAELLRLEWAWIDIPAKVIRLPFIRATKQRKRRIPIQPNLALWLVPFSKRKGNVFSSEKATDRTIQFVKAKGLVWPDNWARHSYGSYRAVITKSVGQVAMELGNSETIVKRHYFDAFADETDAAAWFNITPGAHSAKIVQMKGAA
jgi:integrase